MRLKLTKNLDVIRTKTHERIDLEAGEQRKRFITVVPGQEMVYQLKLEEARKVLEEKASTKSVPHIAAEAKLAGRSLKQQAELVTAKAREWAEASARIELIRMCAKRKVEEASTPAELEAAAEVSWAW